VVQEALEFAFEALQPGVLLEIERIPLIGACPVCKWTGPPEEDYCLICPRCNSPVNIVSGREMQVEWIELEDHLNGTSRGRDQSSEPERSVRRS
jgi:Zn finger protein HypA/HybF involved in hydrogenase expression